MGVQGWHLPRVLRFRGAKLNQKTKEVDQERLEYLSLFDVIKIQMEEATEILINEMSERFTRFHDLDYKFGFLLKVNQLIYKETENHEICH